jgi:aminoglycoside phosphotransferase (APT) family kinase protein
VTKNGESVNELSSRLVRFLERAHGAHRVQIDGLRQLTGGASRQTWSLDATIEMPDGTVRTLPLVLRSDGGRGPSFMARATEYRVLEAAGAENVPVPRVHLMGDDSLRGPFFLMERVEGETIPRRVLRDDRYAAARGAMVRELGGILASIHRIPLARYDLGDLPRPRAGLSAAAEALTAYEEIYRGMTPDPHPAFELAFRWLRERCPAGPAEDAADLVLVHGDYRLGNFIVGPDAVRAILDWELAHVGDPLEDIGWLCVRSWRFGNDELPVAGVGRREELWDAYEAAGGRAVDPLRARFWEAYGNLRWGIICIIQAGAYLDGQSTSIELASIGRRVAETEWELLNLMEES